MKYKNDKSRRRHRRDFENAKFHKDHADKAKTPNKT